MIENTAPAGEADIAADRQAWKAKPHAERDAAYRQALDDLASGHIQPEGPHRRT